MTTQQIHPRPQVQLPPDFQLHPENAVGVITIDQVIEMMKLGYLTFEGACYLLPPRAWLLLPKPQRAKVQPKRRGWLNGLMNLGKRHG